MRKYNSLKNIEARQGAEDVVHKKTWTWDPCAFTLEKSTEGAKVYLNTTPSIQLQLTSQSDNAQLGQFTVEMGKDFCYDRALSWYWHKSWILPEISVNVSFGESLDHHNSLKDVFLHLYITKMSTINQNVFLTDIGVLGETVLRAEAGKNVFSALKFNSTSFKHSNSKFNVLILAILKTEKKTLTCDVLASFISPPIFVDSRRIAPKTPELTQQTKFYSLFDPNHFDRTCCRKRNGINVKIGGELEDLINYFRAPNIRNKVKNPLFLCYKFSAGLTAYYNTDLVQTYQSLVESLFKILNLSGLKTDDNLSTHKCKMVHDKITPATLLCILVETHNQVQLKEFKKIATKFDIGENQQISFMFTQELIASRFKQIKDLQVLRHAYQNYYKGQLQAQGAEQSDLRPSLNPQNYQAGIVSLVDPTATNLATAWYFPGQPGSEFNGL